MGVAVRYQPLLTVAGEEGDAPVYPKWVGSDNSLHSLPFELRYTCIQAQPLQNFDRKSHKKLTWINKIQLLLRP